MSHHDPQKHFPTTGDQSELYNVVFAIEVVRGEKSVDFFSDCTEYKMKIICAK